MATHVRMSPTVETKETILIGEAITENRIGTVVIRLRERLQAVGHL